MLKKLIISVAICSLMGFSGAAQAGQDITIEVNNLRNQNGSLLLAVFDNQKAFKSLDYKQAIASISMKMHANNQKMTLHDMPEGNYAITILHDENNNGKLDMNEREFPIEGYAYSNNVGEADAPIFEDASFIHSNKTSSQSLKMIYIK